MVFLLTICLVPGIFIQRTTFFWSSCSALPIYTMCTPVPAPTVFHPATPRVCTSCSLSRSNKNLVSCLGLYPSSGFDRFYLRLFPRFACRARFLVSIKKKMYISTCAIMLTCGVSCEQSIEVSFAPGFWP